MLFISDDRHLVYRFKSANLISRVLPAHQLASAYLFLYQTPSGAPERGWEKNGLGGAETPITPG